MRRGWEGDGKGMGRGWEGAENCEDEVGGAEWTYERLILKN